MLMLPPPPMHVAPPPPPMPPRMCSCDTYEVSGASTLAALAMGRFDRVGKHPHHDSSSSSSPRPFDVFRNSQTGTYLFFWAPSLDWYIGKQICSYQSSSCAGVIARASHDSNVGCPYATAGSSWSAKRTGAQGQTEYVPLPDLTIECPTPPASPPVAPISPPPPISPESGGYLNGPARVAGVLGGALGSLLLLSTFLYIALCRPKRDANLSRLAHENAAAAATGHRFGPGEWEHDPPISIATGVPVTGVPVPMRPRGTGTPLSDPVIGVPAPFTRGSVVVDGSTQPGTELVSMPPPSAQTATVVEGLVAPGRALPDALGVPVGVSGSIASGRAVSVCPPSGVSAAVHQAV